MKLCSQFGKMKQGCICDEVQLSSTPGNWIKIKPTIYSQVSRILLSWLNEDFDTDSLTEAARIDRLILHIKDYSHDS